jgi:hypothetical protein
MEIKREERFLQKLNANLTVIHLLENLVSGLNAGESGDIMRKILIESTPVTLSLVEGTGNKTIARGEFGRCDVPTQNGRVYPEKYMQREIDRLQEDLANRRILGELDHPSDGRTSLKRVSHVITGLKIKNGVVIGEAEILNTPEGKTLKALIEANVQVGVSSRAHGSTAPRRDQDGVEDVQEDLILKTYDFVADPAVKTAVPGIYTEDVDDPTLAKMFLDEFPEIAESLKTINDDVLSEEMSSEKKIQKELSEQFERKLRDEILELKKIVRQDILEEVESDPEVAGSKAVLSAIAEMVSAYKKDPNVDDIKAAIKASELEVSEANRERDEAIGEANEAKCWLEIERKISGHPMVESIRKLLGGKKFESSEDAISTLDVLLKDLPEGEMVKKEEAKLGEENAELRGKITLLESKVEELSDKLLKAVKLGERIDEQRRAELDEADSKISELEQGVKDAINEANEAKLNAKEIVESANKELEDANLKVYKLEKVARFTNGRELMTLMEDIHDRSRVDALISERGLTEMGDPDLQRMRKSLGKGQVNSKPIVEEKTPKKRFITGLGHDVSEMITLAGIGVTQED